MSFSYLFDPNKQFQDRNGVNNVGGFLRVYIDGTDDRATTYKDFNGTLNESDIMLDTDGRAVVIVDDNLTFRIEVYERNGSLLWTVTNFTARGEGGGGGSSTPVVVDGTANEINVTENMTAGVKYYTVGLATAVKNVLAGLISSFSNLATLIGNKKDKQTPVTDPSASGAGLEFIDSVTQDANGVITPHKKTVQDGTTSQKGVVQLNNAIDSTSTTEAATPKAVKDAYDELNNKIVARAVFLSQQEWAAQSLLPGDPAKVYYVENGTGEDAYTVYVWKESTSTYEEVDESSIDLDGYWHDGPTTTGSGNVVTNITLGNDGVPQVEKGMSAEPAFSVLPISKGGTGADDAKEAAYNLFNNQVLNDSNAPTGDSILMFRQGTPTVGNGYFLTRKVSLLWSYIKDQISSVLGLSENGYTGNAATATTASDYASGGGIDTALDRKVDVRTGKIILKGNDPQSGDMWYCIAKTKANSYDNSGNVVTITRRGMLMGNLYIGTTNNTNREIAYLYTDLLGPSVVGVVREVDGSDVYMSFWVKRSSTYDAVSFRIIFPERHGLDQNVTYPFTTRSTAPDGITYPIRLFPRINTNSNVGSQTTPVYVDSDGRVQPCTPSGGVMKSNTAELYIAGYVENIPYYNVRNIKNGCVNHVDFSGITNSTCNITFEAPTLSTGEEYDYIISLEGYTNNSGYSTGSVVENCKQVLRYDYVNNLWIGEPLFLQATDWRQICVVRGNTCEWKRVTLS